MAQSATPPPHPEQSDDDQSSDGLAVDPLVNDTGTRYSAQVTEPVLSLVSKKLLRTGWKVNRHLQMCYIFDSVSPAQQWKRGTMYTEDDPWATYGPGPPWPDLTESDKTGTPQQLYFPQEVK